MKKVLLLLSLLATTTIAAATDLSVRPASMATGYFNPSLASAWLIPAGECIL